MGTPHLSRPLPSVAEFGLWETGILLLRIANSFPESSKLPPRLELLNLRRPDNPAVKSVQNVQKRSTRQY